MAIRTYRDLLAWQRSMELAVLLYRETEKMPKTEMYGLTSQIRRACTSIPMNIAEGFGKHTRPELIRGLRMGMGSLCEVRTAYELAVLLRLLQEEQRVLEKLAEVDRVVQALIMSLERKTREERQ